MVEVDDVYVLVNTCDVVLEVDVKQESVIIIEESGEHVVKPPDTCACAAEQLLIPCKKPVYVNEKNDDIYNIINNNKYINYSNNINYPNDKCVEKIRKAQQLYKQLETYARFGFSDFDLDQKKLIQFLIETGLFYNKIYGHSINSNMKCIIDGNEVLREYNSEKKRKETLKAYVYIGENEYGLNYNGLSDFLNMFKFV